MNGRISKVRFLRGFSFCSKLDYKELALSCALKLLQKDAFGELQLHTKKPPSVAEQKIRFELSGLPINCHLFYGRALSGRISNA